MRRHLLLSCAAALLTTGCFYPVDRGQALETRLDKLAADNAAMEKAQKESQEKLASTLPRVDEKLAEMTKALEGLDKASRRSDADIGVQIQKAVEDVAKLRGQVETYVYKIDQLEASLKKLSEDTDKRLLDLQSEQAKAVAEAKRKAEELKRPTDKKEFLALAESKAEAGELAVARQLYAEFFKKWPKDELTGDAHFGLGETFFTEEKWREALYEYGKVVQEYPKTTTAPEALLRSSECFSKLKKPEEARLALEELVKGYPKSEAAKIGRSKLAELDKAAKAKKPAPPPPPAAEKKEKGKK
jgi:tol-pal system protein YbgF